MKFSATVKNIIFENESNGFRIFSVDKDGEERIIKGNSFKVMPGDFLDIEANKVQDPKYGEQYNIIFVERSSKPSMYNIINYLQSGLIKGIGETTARSCSCLSNSFNQTTLKIIYNIVHARLTGSFNENYVVLFAIFRILNFICLNIQEISRHNLETIALDDSLFTIFVYRKNPETIGLIFKYYIFDSC